MFGKTQPKASIRGRIYRSQTQCWEDLGLIYDSISWKGRLRILVNKLKKWLQL